MARTGSDQKAAAPGRVRIIAGRWRGRYLAVPDAIGLRPTPNRVRETLFNWLRERVENARCLDLFGGSGALGFEAASRGAARVVIVEHEARMAKLLAEQANALGADNIMVIHQDAITYLHNQSERFDIVFLDPPYSSPLLAATIKVISNYLAPQACVYFESASPFSALPPDLSVVKQGRAGQAHFFLAEFRG